VSFILIPSVLGRGGGAIEASGMVTRYLWCRHQVDDGSDMRVPFFCKCKRGKERMGCGCVLKLGRVAGLAQGERGEDRGEGARVGRASGGLSGKRRGGRWGPAWARKKAKED
jgi:hypothetical protein